ncbi:hypothetical protein [Marinobacter halophilus]|nr:hypothetical protein [Marinobacter halophilus]GGC67364.1 hypothetical protein GCM10011362_14830 [Marinobacter halophilus]
MESTGSSAFNPATNVDLTFSSFDLSNTDQAPTALSYTRFSDFYTGIQPIASESNETAKHLATVKEIRQHIDRFIGTQSAEKGNGNSYTKIRNPLDLINQVISVGRINNFDEGRRYIRDRISANQAGNYNTRSAGARIRFTDQAAAISQRPLNDTEWNYQTLDWRYLPEGPEGSDLTQKVYRTIQYVARTVSDDRQEEQPELISLLAGARFAAGEFVDDGYNRPEYATADFVSRSFGGIELRQEFIGDVQKDTLYIKSPDRQILDLSRYGEGEGESKTSPDCLRVEINYAMDQVRLYASDGEPARVPDTPDEADSSTSDNPANCINQSEDQAIAAWNVEYSEVRKF